MQFPIVALHNVVSTKMCTDFVKIATGMGFKTLSITNAQGSAAQRGLPTAQKMAIKNDISFFTLSDIDDLIELFQPEITIVVAPSPYGKDVLDSEFLLKIQNKRVLIIFGGNEPGLSRKDLEKGDYIVEVPAGDIGSAGTLTLGLALFTGKFTFRR